MQDGTKIKAQASSRSYLQEETIREHLERARRRVAEMGDPRNDESRPKAKKAQARARREQQEPLEGALEELEKWQARKSGEKAKRETRVSTSVPQARVMKHPDKGFALSYNAQISTDAAHGLIVGVAVTQEANDSAQLLPAVDRVEQRLEKKPQQMVADSGYTTRENMEKMAEREVDFLGTMRQEDVPRGAAGNVQEIEEHGLMLGMFPEAVYSSVEIRVCPGDRCLIYTDGVFEAKNAAQEEFGKSRCKPFLKTQRDIPAARFANPLLDSVAVFSGYNSARAQEDDITLIVLDFQ